MEKLIDKTPNRLIFIRHGIRGISDIPTTGPCCVPLYNYQHELSLYGHIYSFLLGKYIKEKIGKATLVYPDNSTERTIATAIAFAKGNDVCQVKYPVNKDQYFEDTHQITQSDITYSRFKLEEENQNIHTIANEIKKCLPCVILDQSTTIDDTGKISGLLAQLDVLSQVPSFSKLSKTCIKFNCDKQLVQSAFTIKQQVSYSQSIIDELGSKLLGGINTLIHDEKLSVLVGHDDKNIYILGEKMGKTFHAPGYAPGYIPPNSGFVFTLKKIIFASISFIFVIVEYFI